MQNSSIENLISKKRNAKKELAKDFAFNHKKPLLAIILDKELTCGQEEVLQGLLQGVSALDIEAVILADSNLDAISFPHTIILPYSQKSRKRLIEAADMALCFSFNDVEEMLLSGTVPISIKRNEVMNYDPNRETGNAFIAKEESTWGVFAALVRALETFSFPYDWTHILRQGLKSVKN